MDIKIFTLSGAKLNDLFLRKIHDDMKKDCGIISLSLFLSLSVISYHLICMFTEISMYKYINYER